MDAVTELYDADIDRVDLVGKGANGRPLLVLKSEGNLVDAETLRTLLKADDELDVTTPLVPAVGDLAEVPGSVEWETRLLGPVVDVLQS